MMRKKKLLFPLHRESYKWKFSAGPLNAGLGPLNAGESYKNYATLANSNQFVDETFYLMFYGLEHALSIHWLRIYHLYP